MSELFSISSNAILRSEPQYYETYAIFDWKRTVTTFLTREESLILEHIYEKPAGVSEIAKSTGLDYSRCKKFLDQMLQLGYVQKGEIPLEGSKRYKVESERYGNFHVPFLSAPKSIDIFITNRCNLKCQHCFSARNGEFIDLPLTDIRSIFDQMERMGVLEVLLNGGEPLLHPHIKEILLDLTERRFRKIIITNGTLFNEKITLLLKDSGTIPTISLDDSSEERHDSFRGSVGSFRCIMNGFKLLSKKGIQYGINSCLNKDNLKRVRELIELAWRYHASRINFLSLRPAGRMREHLDGIPSYKEYEEAALRLMIERQRFKDKIDVTSDALLHCYTLKESQQEKCHGYVCCQAGINCFSIDCTGYVFPCNIVLHDPNWVIGNIKEEKLLDLWFSPKWAFFRGGVRIKDLKKCSSCKKLSECKDFNCRLEAYLETGDPLGAPLKCNV